jgi:hypothetical protein
MIDRLRPLLRAMRAHPRLTLLAAFLLFALVDPRAALGLVLLLATVLAALVALAVLLTWAFGRPGLPWPKLAALVLGMRWAGRRHSG